MKRYPWVLAGCISGLLATSPMAQDAPDEQFLETVVVTENYMPTGLARATASIEVLDGETVETLNKAQLSDALRTLPGVLLEEQGGAGGLLALSIRGGEGNFTKVLLNGVPLNDPTNVRGGSYDINLLNGISLDRIEVVKGPQSVVHGSDALAGVVHLITPKPGSHRVPALRLEAGEKGYSSARLSAGADIGDAGVAIELGHYDGGEWVSGSQRTTDTLNVQLEWDVSEADQLSAQIHYFDGERTSYPEQSGGPLLAQSMALETSDYRSELLATRWRKHWSSKWQTELRVNRLRYEEKTDSPGIAPYSAVPPNGSDATFTQDSASVRSTVRLTDQHTLAFGLDYREEEGDSAGYLDFGFRLPTDYRLSRDTTGSFVQLSSELSDALDLNVSTRYDDTSSGENQQTSRVGVKYTLGSGLELRANWGEGFKLPSFFALGHALVGNPNLLPEEATGFDLGINWQMSDALTLSAAAFENRYRNLIDFDPQTFTNVNRDRVETQGYELSGTWRPSPELEVAFNLTKTAIDVVGSDRELEGRPDWKSALAVQWQLAPMLSTRLDYSLTGEVINTSLYSGQPLTLALDDQSRLDWRLMWQTSPQIAVDVSVDNILDETFETSIGFPSVGRTLRLGFTFQAK
ncbi:MAG: TonB-dependent receptor [Halieaceae bacterium]|nr:TonB-dependent receptor [Halieaceae bacterium]